VDEPVFETNKKKISFETQNPKSIFFHFIVICSKSKPQIKQTKKKTKTK